MGQNWVMQVEDEAVMLLHDVLVEFPPTRERIRVAGSKDLLPVGSYLLQLGYATPDQILEALKEQQRRAAIGASWPIGDILIAQGIIQPRVLTAVLMIQLAGRLVVPRASGSRLLGERLISQHVLTPTQLASALHCQIGLRRRGTWMRIGEILVQQGVLKSDDLSELL